MHISAPEDSSYRKFSKVRVLWLAVCLVLATCTLISFVSFANTATASSSVAPAPPHPEVENPSAQTHVGHDDDPLVDILIYMKGRANLNDLALSDQKLERRTMVVDFLQDFAAQSQEQILG